MTLRRRLYTIIFEHDTPAGRAFDIALIVAILLSVLVVLLDSVAGISRRFGPWLMGAEWFFTALFSVEYALRLYSSRKPLRYAFSFYGLIDLLAILPTYLSFLFPASRFLITVRIIRLLRIFRILKLVHFVGEANVLATALRRSRHKITVFLLTVLTVVLVVGSLMYVIEGPAAGFTSIPTSIYWAIVTLTTVGYGDIAPITPLGQGLAALLMIVGYGIIAVPTGIVTVELGRAAASSNVPPTVAPPPATVSTVCPSCKREGHDADAIFCKHCGASLGISAAVT